MKKVAVALFLATLAITANAATAATPVAKAIKVLPVKPFLITTLSGGAGDQIAAFTTTPISIVIVGSVETTTASTGTTSGNSDGYIQAIDYLGATQWSLHLGGAGDEIATAIVKDKAGGFVVAGAASAAPTASAPAPVDTGVVTNPDGVTLEPISTPKNSLTQLTIWRVSATGQLLSTTAIDAGGVVNPTNLVATATGFTLSGKLYQGGSASQFSTSISSSYQLVPVTSKPITKEVAPAAITTIKAGTMLYKSYLSHGAIKGIPSWKPKSDIPVVIGYNKLAVLKSANYLQGKVIGLQWQSGKGLLILTERSDGFGLTLI